MCSSDLDHFAELCVRRVLYCGGKCIPGIGERCLQYDRICGQTDVCAAPGGKTVVPEWRSDVDLVGISHCGVSQCAVNIVFLGKNLP